MKSTSFASKKGEVTQEQLLPDTNIINHINQVTGIISIISSFSWRILKNFQNHKHLDARYKRQVTFQEHLWTLDFLGYKISAHGI